MSESGEQKTNCLIREMSPDDKPRERALKHGIESLTSTELLAIIFGSGMRGKSVIELSREILNSVDNRLDKLARLSIPTLSNSYDGVGPAKALSLAASIELGRRCQRELDCRFEREPQLNDSRRVYSLMRKNLEMIQHEEFWCLYINRNNRLISKMKISMGGVHSTVVDVKLIIKNALENLASGLILVHNHPSGALNPSDEDDSLTKKIDAAARFFDMRVLDHLIISSDGFFSYADHGKI